MNRLSGKSIVVTGAAQGLGRSCAFRVAEEGAAVAVADIDGEGAANAARDIAYATGAKTVAITVDVSMAADAERMTAEVVAAFGKLDGAVNNAGISGPPRVRLADYEPADFERVVALNLTGTFLCLKYEIAAMLGTGGGSIVNVSSVGGLIGAGGSSAYISSKHAVLGLTKDAAIDYGKDGIRVNALCPGSMLTPMAAAWYESHPEDRETFAAMTPLNRVATPDEVSHAVVYLLSDESTYTTGHALATDGGAAAW